MVTLLSYISNACHSLSGVAERLQHTQCAYPGRGQPSRCPIARCGPLAVCDAVEGVDAAVRANQPVRVSARVRPPVITAEGHHTGLPAHPAARHRTARIALELLCCVSQGGLRRASAASLLDDWALLDGLNNTCLRDSLTNTCSYPLSRTCWLL